MCFSFCESKQKFSLEFFFRNFPLVVFRVNGKQKKHDLKKNLFVKANYYNMDITPLSHTMISQVACCTVG